MAAATDVDPTTNVLQLVEAATKRQDDLRLAEAAHIREVIKLRAEYDAMLRDAESKRIDAIRAVDVGAVNRAAEVATAVAQTLAAQVATSAETLRNQVTAASTAQTIALAAALEPIQKDIGELRKTQYEQAGQKVGGSEAKGLAAELAAALAPLRSDLRTLTEARSENVGERQQQGLQVAHQRFSQAQLLTIMGFLVAVAGVVGHFAK